MFLYLRPNLDEEKQALLRAQLTALDLEVLTLSEKPLLWRLAGELSPDEVERLSTHPWVERSFASESTRLYTDRAYHPQDTVFHVGGQLLGGQEIALIAGPCAVESLDQMEAVAKYLVELGVPFLRGGAYKPRTSPHSFQGLAAEGMDYLLDISKRFGLPVVSELTSLSELDYFAEHVDLIQVGARQMQHYELLRALGRLDKAVLLKRGFANTIDELLYAAEYLLVGGNARVILCERGIRSFEPSTRTTLDLSAVPILKRKTHLPVFVDPSHATGRADLVPAMALAAVAAGADGLELEVHPKPYEAYSDAGQALDFGQMTDLLPRLEAVATAVGRKLACRE